MSNTSKGLGEKGSKYWMGIFANLPDFRDHLNHLISADTELNWHCPIKESQYQEYELRQEDIRKKLYIDPSEDLFPEWPGRQAQWDGIAVDVKTKTIYLVEAKSHIEEMRTYLKPSSDSDDATKSYGQRKELIEKLYSDKTLKSSEKWCNGYYQLANRLWFLSVFSKAAGQGKLKYENVKLILLNFCDDWTHKTKYQTDLKKWEDHYQKVWNELTVNGSEPDNVIVQFISVAPGNLPGKIPKDFCPQDTDAKKQYNEWFDRVGEE